MYAITEIKSKKIVGTVFNIKGESLKISPTFDEEYEADFYFKIHQLSKDEFKVRLVTITPEGE